METEIQKQSIIEGKTYIDFRATPTRYYDSYKLYEIEYEEEGQVKTKEVSLRINTPFYKELYTYEDWQTIEIGTYQNYRLMNDIDFANREDIKTEVTIGRLEAEGEPKKLKNIKIAIDKSETGLIKNVRNSIKNITFENIEITSSTSSTIQNIGIIGTTTGTYENIEFSNIKIQTENAERVGCIGSISYGEINNITLKDIEIEGKNYVGSFIGYTSMTTITNITANDITIIGTNYIGGIFGYKSYDGSTATTIAGKITADNITVTGTSYIGGILGYGVGHDITLTNSNITGQTRVGGILGSYDSCWNAQDLINLSVQKTTIQGSKEYIGGIAGYLNSADSYLQNTEIVECNIIGTTVDSNYVGGLIGWYNYYICNTNVRDSLISSKGNYVGGIVGSNVTVNSNNNYYYNFIQNTTIEGYSKVGGIVGQYKRGTIDYNYVNANINATGHTVGGIVGYLDNTGMTNANNVSNIYNNYVAGTTINAPEKVGGIIGDSTQELLEGHYYNNFIEANLKSENIQTTSLGIGGRKQDSQLTNTYIYKYSILNGEYVNTSNDTFQEEYYATLENLKDRNFYINKLKWNTYTYNYNMLTQNKYPTLSPSYNTSPTQTGIDLPEEPTGMQSLSQEALPQITAYSVSANMLNIDLSSVPAGTTLTYKTANTEANTIELTKKTYTFAYNYQEPITLTLENMLEEETIKITPEEVKNTASIQSNTIAYLEGESLVVNGENVEGTYKNLIEGQALLENGDIYNIAENKVEEQEKVELQLVETKPKTEYTYKGNQIETYGTYSKVNGKETEAIYTVRDGILSITDGKLEKVQSDKIVDSYNGKDYETILGTDGKLYDLKETIKYPENFKNEGIKTISLDITSQRRAVMVYYENGSILVFNYITGETIYEQTKKQDITLWEYMQGEWNKEEETGIGSSYETSKQITEKLEEKPINPETGKNATYITMYNSKTNTHEIYQEEELLTLNDEQTKSETEKIEEDETLKEYYLTPQGKEIQLNQSFYLVMGSIIAALIGLIILKHITVKRKTKKAK